MSPPKTVSIITPVLNRANTIRDCIESVLAQDYPIEYIIVDGGSKDGTLEIIREYSSRLAKVVSEPDRNNYEAGNKGIALATGDIIGILAADDAYADNKVISKVAAAFKTGIDSCYGDLVYVDRDDTNKVIRYWKSCAYDRKLFYSGWMPPHPTFFVRRSIYEAYGAFRLDHGTAADYELMLRFLLKHGLSAGYIPEVLVRMRTGGSSGFSIRNRIIANLYDRKAWKINGLKPKPWTLFLKPLSKIKQYFSTLVA
jgi:glycosyltransferase involved in cell wall biosynthesis